MSRKSLPLAAALLFTILSAGCGGGGGGNDDLDLAGTWTATVRMLSNSCGPVLPAQTVQATLTQSGNTISIRTNDGTQFTATISGGSLTFSGSASTTSGRCVATVTYSGGGSAAETRIQGTVQTTVRLDQATCGLGTTCNVSFDYTLTR